MAELQQYLDQSQVNNMKQALEASKKVLAERQAILDQLNAQQDNLPTRSQIATAQRRAQELASTDPAKSAEYAAQAAAFTQQRADFTAAYSIADRNVQDAQNAVSSNERTLAEVEARYSAGNYSAESPAATTITPDQDPAAKQADAAVTFSVETPVAISTTVTEEPEYTQPSGVQAFQAATARLAEQNAAAAQNNTGIPTQTKNAQSAATQQDLANANQNKDWRLRISLAPGAGYLYNAAGPNDILAPLKETNGVIFPYTPAINVSYQANYDPIDLAHTNYKFYQYKNSEVSQIQITGDFTAQDTEEANYLLAVIHFFKSVTKMFYGQDSNPPNGVPPPLVYLTGFGAFQFDRHPVVVQSFSYSLPNDIDYIRAGSVTNNSGVNLSEYQYKVNTYVPKLARLLSSGLNEGGKSNGPQFQSSLSNSDATYVPTKIQLQIVCMPIITRKDITNNFSLEKYAKGELTRGSRRNGGGIW